MNLYVQKEPLEFYSLHTECQLLLYTARIEIIKYSYEGQH